MSERNEGRVPIAKEYPDMSAFNQDTRDVFAGKDTGMYQRYDYKELVADERKFAEMIGVPDTALFNSGMAAIHTAIEAEGLKSGDVVFCSDVVYGVTKDYVEGLKKLGIIVKYFDPSDMESLKIKTHEYKPRLFFVETVSNSKEMKVVDLPALAELISTTNDEYGELTTEKCLERCLSLTKIAKKMPEFFKQKFLQVFLDYERTNKEAVFDEIRKEIVDGSGLTRKEVTDLIVRIVKYVKTQRMGEASLIVDNTLPSPVLINPVEEVGEVTSKMTVVESGTKHFQDGKNAITMGIVYSKNQDRVKKIKNLRIQAGSHLQSTSEVEIPRDITDLMPEKIKKHSENALKLARILEGKGFTVYHPNLDSHPQHKLANDMAPNGAVTLFYIICQKAYQTEMNLWTKLKKPVEKILG